MSTNEEELAGAALVQRGPITELSPETKQQLELARQFVTVVGAIGGMSWGQGLTPGIRKAIAEYCRVYDVDPLTELDVLGGSFYVNSEWFLRKLGDMMRRGDIESFWLAHIHKDERLREVMQDPEAPAEIRAEAADAWYRAKLQRALHNAPENAEAICVAYIKLPGIPRPITGCKWGGNGTSIQQPNRGGGSRPNPVVENNAALSVESQAIRRAVRQVSSHVGSRLPDFDKMDSDLTALGNRAEAVVAQQQEIDARLAAEAHPPKALTTQAPGFIGYGEGITTEPLVKTAPAPEPVQRDAAVAEAQRAVAHMEDPYQEPAARPLDGEVLQGSPAPYFATDEDTAQSIRVPFELREAAPIILDSDGSPAGATPAQECPECERPIRRGHPEDHKSTCSKYADPD